MPDPITAIARPLPGLPAPDAIEAMLGYGGSARYVGCAGDRAAGVVRTFDGWATRYGYAWVAWLCFLEHNRVWPHLTGYTVQGQAGADSEHWLVLDRIERGWYVAPAAAARRWLLAQQAGQSLGAALDNDQRRAGRPARAIEEA